MRIAAWGRAKMEDGRKEGRRQGEGGSSEKGAVAYLGNGGLDVHHLLLQETTLLRLLCACVCVCCVYCVRVA